MIDIGNEKLIPIRRLSAKLSPTTNGTPATLDTRSDFYALGVFAYEILTGEGALRPEEQNDPRGHADHSRGGSHVGQLDQPGLPC